MTFVSETLLREVPPELIEAVRLGTMKLYGSIIRDASTGRISGFLQETGAAPLLMDALRGAAVNGSPVATTVDISPIGLAIKAANLGISAVGVVQNEQIKAQLSFVTTLQLGNLLLTGAGIGVSIAGFAILSARIAAVERKVDALGEKLDAIARSIDGLRRERIAEHLTTLRTVAERYEEGWEIADPGRHWRDTATDAHFLVNQFDRLATEVLDRDSTDFQAVEPFWEALALATSLRVNARLAVGEETIAVRAAEDGARMLIDIGDCLNVGKAALARMAAGALEAGTAGWNEALDVEARTLGRFTGAARARETSAVATALTVRELIDRNVPGRRFLEEARHVSGTAIKLFAIDPV